jgi:hypothetical protein
MSQTESEEALDHVFVSRLLDVAKSDERYFTSDEVNHLKDCFVCLSVWKHFIREKTKSC